MSKYTGRWLTDKEKEQIWEDMHDYELAVEIDPKNQDHDKLMEINERLMHCLRELECK